MAAKVLCKKGYNAKDGGVEFKTLGQNESCPVSDASCCEECKAGKFLYKE